MAEEVFVNGTLIWYYYICKREVWLMSHQLVPDQGNENIELGRFLHESSYRRTQKEIRFGAVKFDVLEETKGKLVIGEVKKTSRFQQSSMMQLAYYLLELEKVGISAVGELRYPAEKKRITVALTPDIKRELYEASEEIRQISLQDIPPPVEKNKYCSKCGYREFCWA